jgi:Protein of unknown function (DUF3892)
VGDFMARYQITCIRKREHYNPHERITHIGNQADNWMLTENAAIRRIKSGADSFYTYVNRQEADVVVAVHNLREYLKTTADGYEPNNLLSLPDCRNCRVIE